MVVVSSETVIPAVSLLWLGFLSRFVTLAVRTDCMMVLSSLVRLDTASYDCDTRACGRLRAQ
jgi:hypothetical protein